MTNWDDMRVFLAVARAESLSAAAPLLKMDPATVGRRIARLEDALGAALFVKTPQGYALTDHGIRIRQRAAEAEGEDEARCMRRLEAVAEQRQQVGLDATLLFAHAGSDLQHF